MEDYLETTQLVKYFMGPLFWTSGDVTSEFQSRVGSLIRTWWRHTCYTFPEIHLWRDTCWPLGSQHGSQTNPHIHDQALVGIKWATYRARGERSTILIRLYLRKSKCLVVSSWYINDLLRYSILAKSDILVSAFTCL